MPAPTTAAATQRGTGPADVAAIGEPTSAAGSSFNALSIVCFRYLADPPQPQAIIRVVDDHMLRREPSIRHRLASGAR